MTKKICKKCDTPLQMGIKTLNEEDWFCPKCSDWRIIKPLGPLRDSHKICDICGKAETQVYCINCLDNSNHINYFAFAQFLKAHPEFTKQLSEGMKTILSAFHPIAEILVPIISELTKVFQDLPKTMLQELNKKIRNIPKRRAMKCQICYSDELGKCSDIENSEDRFDALNDFFLKIQDITYRETKREFLKNWRRFMKNDV